jgi:hypothetical protein
MAIHDDYPGLTVEIIVDGKPLEECKDEEEEEVPKTTTRYIECRSGAEFGIRTTFKSPPFVSMSVLIRAHLDGELSAQNIAFDKRMVDTRIVNQTGSRWKDGTSWRQSNLAFSELELGKCYQAKLSTR